MADLVTLYNLALDTVGARNNVSLPTEASREAEDCTLWFPVIRDQVLASASWPEATKMARLAQLSTQDDETWDSGEPRPDLLYTFAAPPDMLRPQYFSDYQKFAVQSYGSDGQKAFMTNSSSPILIYTFQQTSINAWSSELYMAIMQGLAARICVPLTGKTSRAKMLIDQANQLIMAARESAANMNSEKLDAIPDWIAARGFVDSMQQQLFVYPFGPLLAANVN